MDDKIIRAGGEALDIIGKQYTVCTDAKLIMKIKAESLSISIPGTLWSNGQKELKIQFNVGDELEITLPALLQRKDLIIK